MKRVALYALLFVMGAMWRTPLLRGWFMFFFLTVFLDSIFVIAVATQIPKLEIAFHAAALGGGLLVGLGLSRIPSLRRRQPTHFYSDYLPALIVLLVLAFADGMMGPDTDEFLPVMTCGWLLAVGFMMRGMWGEDLLYLIGGIIISATICNMFTWPAPAFLVNGREMAQYGSDHKWGNLSDALMVLIFTVVTMVSGLVTLPLLPSVTLGTPPPSIVKPAAQPQLFVSSRDPLARPFDHYERPIFRNVVERRPLFVMQPDTTTLIVSAAAVLPTQPLGDALPANC